MKYNSSTPAQQIFASLLLTLLFIANALNAQDKKNNFPAYKNTAEIDSALNNTFIELYEISQLRKAALQNPTSHDTAKIRQQSNKVLEHQEYIISLNIERGIYKLTDIDSLVSVNLKLIKKCDSLKQQISILTNKRNPDANKISEIAKDYIDSQHIIHYNVKIRSALLDYNDRENKIKQEKTKEYLALPIEERRRISAENNLKDKLSTTINSAYEHQKSEWAVFDKKALRLIPYDELEADANLNETYSIDIPACVMPYVKYNNGENNTQEYLRKVTSTDTTTKFKLLYNYYLSTDVRSGKGPFMGNQVVIGSFINQTRYREDRDAFCALVDTNEKDLTKKVKWLIPISLQDDTGDQLNDYGLKMHLTNDGFIYIIVAGVKYGNNLRNDLNGKEATFSLFKLDAAGNIIASNESFLSTDSKLTVRLTNERNSIPVIRIFEDKKQKGQINIISRAIPKSVEHIFDSGGESVIGNFENSTSYTLIIDQFDESCNIKNRRSTFDGIHDQVLIKLNSSFNADFFRSFGGVTQDEKGNTYLIINFNDNIYYRVGTNWLTLSEIFRNEKYKFDARKKPTNNYDEQLKIQKDWDQFRINKINATSAIQESFYSKAIYDNRSAYRSNIVFLKFDDLLNLVHCKPILSEEPRIIYTVKHDNSNQKIILEGLRGNSLGTRNPFNSKLKIEVDYDGNVIYNDGKN